MEKVSLNNKNASKRVASGGKGKLIKASFQSEEISSDEEVHTFRRGLSEALEKYVELVPAGINKTKTNNGIIRDLNRIEVEELKGETGRLIELLTVFQMGIGELLIMSNDSGSLETRREIESILSEQIKEIRVLINQAKTPQQRAKGQLIKL